MSREVMRPSDHVYVALFTNGIVKIGRTNTPMRRVSEIQRDPRCEKGTVVRFWSKPTTRANPMERFALQIAADMGAVPVRWGTEFLRSIDFDQIVSIIDAAINEYGTKRIDVPAMLRDYAPKAATA